MLTVKIKAAMKCPRHSRFNGSGEHAIRGGCPICFTILDAKERARQLRASIERFNDLARANAPALVVKIEQPEPAAPPPLFAAVSSALLAQAIETEGKC